MVITGSVQAESRRVQPAGYSDRCNGLAAIDWEATDSGIYWNAQQATPCCGYQRLSGLQISPAGARYLVWSHLWNYNVCSDVVKECDVDRRCSDEYQSRTSTPSGHQSALQGDIYLVVPITYRQSSRQAASG